MLNCYEQDDPRLVSVVRDQVLIQPDYGQEYNLSEAGTLDAFYASREVFEEDLALEMEETYLRDKKNGFFIEAGASEGIKINTSHIHGDDDINTQESQTPTASCSRRGTAGPGCWWSQWSTVSSSNTARYEHWCLVTADHIICITYIPCRPT